MAAVVTKLLRTWTIGRATGVGTLAALAALLLWPAYAILQNPFRLAFAASLVLLIFCGLSILFITGADLLIHKRRGRRIHAIRALDVVLGTLMTVPAILTLPSILG